MAKTKKPFDFSIVAELFAKLKFRSDEAFSAFAALEMLENPLRGAMVSFFISVSETHDNVGPELNIQSFHDLVSKLQKGKERS